MLKRPTPPDIETQILVIGAGVTGINVSKCLLDKGIDFWLLGSPYESQLAKAGELENTDLPEGTVGLDFIESEFEDLKSKGLQHRSSMSTGIEKTQNGFLVKTKFQNFKANGVVIATGNKQKSLGFNGEQDYFQKGISDCTVCDFPLFRGKPVAVVGNHEYTVRAAKFMRQYTDSVALLWYKSDNCPEIDDISSYSYVEDLKASGDEDMLTHISFKHANGDEELKVRALFVEGEPVPSIDFLQDLGIETENKHIKVSENFETNISNIWAVGDVIGKTKNYETAKNQALDLGQKLAEKFNQ